MAQIRVAGNKSRLDGKLKLSPVACEAVRPLWGGCALDPSRILTLAGINGRRYFWGASALP